MKMYPQTCTLISQQLIKCRIKIHTICWTCKIHLVSFVLSTDELYDPTDTGENSLDMVRELQTADFATNLKILVYNGKVLHSSPEICL